MANPFDIEQYASLRARLSAASAEGRQAILNECGLDEPAWEVIDDDFQEQLSRSLDAPGDDVPGLLVRYSQTFAEAQRHIPGELLTFEEFVACTRAIQRARDVQHALERLGVDVSRYLKANQHWSPKIAKDAELAARFRTLITPKVHRD